MDYYYYYYYYYAAFNAPCVGHNEYHLATLTLVGATEMGNFGVVQ